MDFESKNNNIAQISTLHNECCFLENGITMCTGQPEVHPTFVLIEGLHSRGEWSFNMEQEWGEEMDSAWAERPIKTNEDNNAPYSATPYKFLSA